MTKTITLIAAAAAIVTSANAQNQVPVQVINNAGGFITNAIADMRGVCFLKIVNKTDFYVDIYTDDEFFDDADPYGTAFGYVQPGWTELYAKAPGTSYYWGPRDVQLKSSGSFRWTLNN